MTDTRNGFGRCNVNCSEVWAELRKEICGDVEAAEVRAQFVAEREAQKRREELRHQLYRFTAESVAGLRAEVGVKPREQLKIGCSASRGCTKEACLQVGITTTEGAQVEFMEMFN